MANVQTKTLIYFLITTFLLSILGILFIYSASSIFALEKYGIAHYFAKRQFYGCMGAVILVACVGKIPLSFLYACTPFIFAITLMLNLLLFIAPSSTITIHGSARWLHISSFSFQPSELLKVATILMLTYSMSRRSYAASSFITSMKPLICITLISAGTLLLQPDFGQAVLITITGSLLFMIAHAQLSYLLLLAIPFALLLIGLIIKAPYRLRRIATFLNPWNDPQGSGFQVIQSLIAIGSGGLMGRGIAQSQQKFFYLPMQHTDFIFSIIAEETGFLGTCLVLFLYILFLYWGIKLAAHCATLEASLITFGYVIMISLQAVMNLAVTTGLAPTKGIGLPFISYGISSLWAHAIMIGIIVSAVRSKKPDIHF